MRCIFTNRTTGMTSFSIGTNPTIGTNGPSEIALYPARSHGKIIKVPLMRCIFTNRTTGMTSFSIGTNRTIGTNGPSEIALYPARPHGKIIKVPLMRCIFTNRTIGMTSFSIGTNPTIGTNGPSVRRIVSVCVYWTCVFTRLTAHEIMCNNFEISLVVYAKYHYKSCNYLY